MITRCPKCHTSFRITQGQLQTAKGSVRCGSCLHIFKAMDHLVQDKVTQGKAQRTRKPVDHSRDLGSTPAKKANPSARDASAAKTTSKPSDAAAARAAATSPKFKYKKPNPAAVSAKDVERALRSSLGAGAAKSSTSGQTKPRPSHLDSEHPEIPDTEADGDRQNMFKFDQAAIDADALAGDDENLLISDDMPTGDENTPNRDAYDEGLGESFLNLDNWARKETSLFDRESKPPKEEEDGDEKRGLDESWAVDLLEDDDDSEVETNSKVNHTLDELDLETEEPDSESSREEYSRATTGSFNTLEDSDIEDALGEPLGEHIEPKFDSSEQVTEDEFYPEFVDDRDDYNEGDDSGDYYSEEDRSALLKGIKPAPVEFAHYQGNRDWRKNLIWGGSVIVGTMLLVLQVAWLQFDTLSRQQPYRALYSFFCPVFSCTVPPLAAPKMIRASNLVVRSHPDADNALMIDTILLNTAPFNQPFPDLVLNFNNGQGQSMAARRFKPAEYLGGEMAGRSQMPIGQPVHLSLEIVDPGPDAVNYSAYIPN